MRYMHIHIPIHIYVYICACVCVYICACVCANMTYKSTVGKECRQQRRWTEWCCQQNVFSYYRMCSLTIECVLLLQAIECVLVL